MSGAYCLPLRYRKLDAGTVRQLRERDLWSQWLTLDCNSRTIIYRLYVLRLADNLRRRPAEQNQADENFPSVGVSIGRDRKVIADHKKDNWNRHERIMFGA